MKKRSTSIMPNYYLLEKLAQAHQKDLLCEAKQRRILASLSQNRPGSAQHDATHNAGTVKKLSIFKLILRYILSVLAILN
jgi:hypothetical protein